MLAYDEGVGRRGGEIIPNVRFNLEFSAHALGQNRKIPNVRFSLL